MSKDSGPIFSPEEPEIKIPIEQVVSSRGELREESVHEWHSKHTEDWNPIRSGPCIRLNPEWKSYGTDPKQI